MCASPAVRRVSTLAWLLPLVALAACTSGGGGGGGAPGAVFDVQAVSSLDAATHEAFFTLGPEASAPSSAADALIEAGPPRVARAVFRAVPEGRFRVEFVGYRALTFVAPNPVSFPATALCMSEAGAATVDVARGPAPSVSIAPAPVSGERLGIDRRVLESAYTASPDDPTFGSPNGRAIAHLFLDAWAPGAVVQLSTEAAALGLFAALPDTSSGSWPAPAAWHRDVTVTTDVNGDGHAVAVVAPGAPSGHWQIVASATGEDAQVRGWVSAVRRTCTLAECDDGDPCTDDACGAGDACVHAPRGDGAHCADDAICLATVCTPGLRIGAIEQTGWASTEGGFNRNHAELRVGDDGRGETAEYQLYAGLTFPLADIPEDVQGLRAEMHVYQVRVDGDAPYGALQHELVAELVRYTNMWEADEATALASQTPVSATRDLGWRFANVTGAVTNERGVGSPTVQLRVRFVPAMADEDAAIDWTVLASDNEPDVALRPHLVVWWD
jgi:hypothetical protein